MYVNSVLSFLGAWEKLQNQRPTPFAELMFFGQSPDFDFEIPFKNWQNFNDFIKKTTFALWDSNVSQAYVPIGRDERAFARIGLLRDRIGLEIFPPSFRDVESKLLVDFPEFFRANRIDIAVILVPMESVAAKKGPPVASFEQLYDRLTSLPPSVLRYPFALIGYSAEEADLSITELTTELDRYLLGHIGVTLAEARLTNETKQLEFKVDLPKRMKDLAKEVCAFANATGGGLILIGIDKDGNIQGLPPGKELDDKRLQITNVIQESCSPAPEFEIQAFRAPDQENRMILAIRVNELPEKPCMSSYIVYVRVDASARPAGPEEIRRLIVR